MHILEKKLHSSQKHTSDLFFFIWNCNDNNNNNKKKLLDSHDYFKQTRTQKSKIQSHIKPISLGQAEMNSMCLWSQFPDQTLSLLASSQVHLPTTVSNMSLRPSAARRGELVQTSASNSDNEPMKPSPEWCVSVLWKWTRTCVSVCSCTYWVPKY